MGWQEVRQVKGKKKKTTNIVERKGRWKPVRTHSSYQSETWEAKMGGKKTVPEESLPAVGKVNPSSAAGAASARHPGVSGEKRL